MEGPFVFIILTAQAVGLVGSFVFGALCLIYAFIIQDNAAESVTLIRAAGVLMLFGFLILIGPVWTALALYGLGLITFVIISIPSSRRVWKM